ncbi:MAG: hypothetical protein ACI84K_001247 [Pseudohongiellaceae bacterium]|jgi:hypothetical protein
MPWLFQWRQGDLVMVNQNELAKSNIKPFTQDGAVANRMFSKVVGVAANA